MAAQSGKSQWDTMDQRQWREWFRCNILFLISTLTREEVSYIARRLQSKGMLFASELEQVMTRISMTPTETVRILIEFVLKKDSLAMYRSFFAVLKDDLGRSDLVKRFDFLCLCRVKTKTNSDQDQKIYTRKSSRNSAQQSCSMNDSHSFFVDHLPLISFEFKEMMKEKMIKRVEFCEIPISPEILSESDAIQKVTISRQELARVGFQLQNFRNITTLRIIHCKLTQIPQEVMCLTKLEELDLHGNCLINPNITHFSSHLPQLKVLDVRECGLEEIPDWFGNLLQLEELLISGNSFTGGLGRSLERLKMLRYIDMEDCNLLNLPDWLAELNTLQEIDLANNNFSDGINPAIGQLHRLKKLDLSQCELSTLPTSFGDLEQLEELNLSYNNFPTGLNEALGRLRQLKALYIGSCGLLTIPDWIQNLEQLQEIDLSNNDLSNGINAGIGQLHRLMKLDLSQCELSTLPSVFADLEQLIDLRLKGNRLKVYPEYTLRLSNLQRLDISLDYSVRDEHLGVAILPVELADSRLSELILDGNPITEPPKEIWLQGLEAIKSYFKEQRSHGITEVLPDTINMIGDVCAGKTSIAKSLQELYPQPAGSENRTYVLDQLQVNFGRNRECLVNINEFGGHAIYHSVISIFLPTDGLVILAYDMSKDIEEQSRAVRPWLLTVIEKSKEIRLIVVGTHADKRREIQEKLTSDMEKFVLDVLSGAKDEIDQHIRVLKNELTLDGKRQWTSMKERKQQQLEKLIKRLDEALVHVLSLSCHFQDSGLLKLHQLVSDMLRAPISMPRRWSAVMEDITNAPSKCYYLKWNEVQEIYKRHITDVDNDRDLSVILRYLSSTSQIIWLENHNTLGNFVFHSPKKIIEVCKNVLHNDRARLTDQQWPDSWATIYSKDITRYAQGIVHRPFINMLLSADDEKVDIAVDFLKTFNLISEIKPFNHNRMFLIPSNLPNQEPENQIGAFNRLLNDSSERLVMELSFIGTVIPKSFFETSVSSMLSAAHDLAKPELSTVAWRDGLFITYKKVCFVAKRKENTITLTAFSIKNSHMDPWTILRPVFECLHRYITRTWLGALPECDILCPACHLKSLTITNSGGKGIGKFERPFEMLSCVSLTETHNWTCPECFETIPRLLCLPTATGQGTRENTTTNNSRHATNNSGNLLQGNVYGPVTISTLGASSLAANFILVLALLALIAAIILHLVASRADW